jgi:protoporphyrinogen oxidase
LFGAVVSAIFPWKRRKFKTLIDHFYYPKYGPGMMWEAFTERCKRLGVDIRMGSQVVGLTQTESKYTAVIKNGKGSTSELSQFDSVLSTMPLRELIAMLPNVPEEVSQAAQRLKYRDFITALVIINKEKIFDDNWIYIHDPEVRAGRIQNFKNWSEWMVPDSSTTSLGLEYFIFEDEELWNKPDDFFNELARKEVVQLGFCTRDEILDSTILRVKKAYPVYDEEYKRVVEIIAKFLSTIPSVYTAGRNGLHRWNNQDHSMIAGMTAAQEILSSQKTGKIWNINTDSEYGETSVSDREIPKRIFPR